MALAARQQAGRLGRLVGLMHSGDAACLDQVQPCRSLFRWATPRVPAEPSVPPRPAKRACGTQEWMDEYRCELATRGMQQCFAAAATRRRRPPKPEGLLLHAAPPASVPSSWLEGSGAEVQRVLRQERRHAEGWLCRTAQLAERLHGEMLELAPTEQVGRLESVERAFLCCCIDRCRPDMGHRGHCLIGLMCNAVLGSLHAPTPACPVHHT